MEIKIHVRIQAGNLSDSFPNPNYNPAENGNNTDSLLCALVNGNVDMSGSFLVPYPMLNQLVDFLMPVGEANLVALMKETLEQVGETVILLIEHVRIRRKI